MYFHGSGRVCLTPVSPTGCRRPDSVANRMMWILRQRPFPCAQLPRFFRFVTQPGKPAGIGEFFTVELIYFLTGQVKHAAARTGGIKFLTQCAFTQLINCHMIDIAAGAGGILGPYLPSWCLYRMLCHIQIFNKYFYRVTRKRVHTLPHSIT